MEFTKEELGLIYQALGYVLVNQKSEGKMAECALLQVKVNELYHETEFVSPNFGDEWENYANKTLPKKMIVEIALHQGRDNIRLRGLLEKELTK